VNFIQTRDSSRNGSFFFLEVVFVFNVDFLCTYMYTNIRGQQVYFETLTNACDQIYCFYPPDMCEQQLLSRGTFFVHEVCECVCVCVYVFVCVHIIIIVVRRFIFRGFSSDHLPRERRRPYDAARCCSSHMYEGPRALSHSIFSVGQKKKMYRNTVVIFLVFLCTYKIMRSKHASL